MENLIVEQLPNTTTYYYCLVVAVRVSPAIVVATMTALFVQVAVAAHLAFCAARSGSAIRS